MWGFFAALISGALMSIQGVFNTEVTRQSSLWVSTGCTAFGLCSLCSGVAFYGETEYCGIVADRK